MKNQLKYPFLDLKDATAPYRHEIIDAVTRVIDSGRYIGGEECQRFEEELCSLCNTRYCVGVSNGLDALRLIFKAYIHLGHLRPGDEVIVPANTYIASVLAITDAGLSPVFVEPDENTQNLDWSKTLEVITSKTRAVLTVHLYGRVSWDDEKAKELKERGILIVEDNAQAIGAFSAHDVSTGALGDAAGFSFYPTKNIGAIGDAGAVTTSDKDLADMVRTLANYGSDRRYHNIVEGYNCRLDPIQAAILRVKLRHIAAENARRRTIAQIYNSQIDNPFIKLPRPADKGMVWHQYVVQTDRRPEFTAFLSAKGIDWDIHYPTPPHLQPCYNQFSGLHLPITERIARTVVSLPVSPSTSSNDATEIAALISTFQ